jgi:hypothetical protein
MRAKKATGGGEQNSFINLDGRVKRAASSHAVLGGGGGLERKTDKKKPHVSAIADRVH